MEIALQNRDKMLDLLVDLLDIVY